MNHKSSLCESYCRTSLFHPYYVQPLVPNSSIHITSKVPATSSFPIHPNTPLHFPSSSSFRISPFSVTVPYISLDAQYIYNPTQPDCRGFHFHAASPPRVIRPGVLYVYIIVYTTYNRTLAIRTIYSFVLFLSLYFANKLDKGHKRSHKDL